MHRGHTAIAENLLRLFALDEVLFIPAHLAPHKREREVTSGWHRYAMLVLATQDELRERVSTIELDAPERPYTIETLSKMKETLGVDARIFFIMGADSWMEINTWREWEKLLQLTDHIVVTRPGYELGTEHVTEAIRERVFDLRNMDQEKAAHALNQVQEPRIYVTDAVLMDISATAIRRAVFEQRDDWRMMVPSPVADYIEKYELYRKQA